MSRSRDRQIEDRQIRSGVAALLAVAAYFMTAATLKIFGPYARVEALAGRLRLPEEQPGISPAAVSIFLGRIGADGRVSYTFALALDFALPILLALAAWSAATWSRTHARPANAPASLLMRVAILAVAAETIENGLLLIATARHPGRPLLANLIGPLVTAKFALIATTGAALIAVIVDTMRRRRISRSSIS